MSEGAVDFLLDESRMTERAILGGIRSGVGYEPETSGLIYSVLEPGDVFFDVGAHVGWFSILGSRKVGDEGAVYSFEPDFSNFSRLLSNIERNKAYNIHPVPMAASYSSGLSTFYLNSDNDGGHALWEAGKHPFNEKTKANPEARQTLTISLDRFHSVLMTENIRCLKIDTEGAEYDVICGASGLLASGRIKHVICEINAFGLLQMDASEYEITDSMKKMGYESEVIGKRPENGDVFNVHFYL